MIFSIAALPPSESMLFSSDLIGFTAGVFILIIYILTINSENLFFLFPPSYTQPIVLCALSHINGNSCCSVLAKPRLQAEFPEISKVTSLGV